MISKTKIGKRIRRKTNPEIVATILALKKNKEWIKVAQIISSSARKYSSVNLDEIEKQTKEGDTVVIPGKVLSEGELTKKVRICSFSISQTAKDRLKKTKSDWAPISEEISKNAKAEGLKIIK